ncbi:gliding motility-associated C-terminal domain-containing protein [Hymenobacter psoromatis]|uniref:T9SS type B sorting domain-containing protein n=1 Tax=Hymenobacter psoromatis TaxID=1484116 RepID=UPI001CBBFA36|nr:gliding motility-associated C-terminal domain-containing protein [Hymenobacter psoromatis]
MFLLLRTCRAAANYGHCWLLIRLAGFLLLAHCAQAQREYYNWYFGERAGLTFLTGPQALTNGTLSLGNNAPACLSDKVGNYQFTTNGVQVWDRTGQVMAGGSSIGPINSVTGATVLAVPQPGRAGRYYIFTNLNWVHQDFKPGFTYAVVDMAQRGGLGAVLSTDSTVALPTRPSSNAEFLLTNLVAVRHANGRDLWIVGQNIGRQTVSLLLTAHGLQQQPVFSPGVRASVVNDGISIALLKATADGKTLAMSTHEYTQATFNATSTTSIFYHEITSFQPESGRATDSYVIPDIYPRGRIRIVNNQYSYLNGVGGVEFSPDGSRLYVDTLGSREVWQYDLLAGSSAAVAASRTVVARLQGTKISHGSNLQLAPDGRIYVADGRNYLGRFELPNAVGTGSTYREAAVALSGNSGDALPFATNDLNLVPVSITDAGGVSNAASCAGGPMQFSSSLSPFVTATAYAWDFGDPTSAGANTAAGQAPAHLYRQPGRYTVALRVTASSGRVFTTSQIVEVQPAPVVALLVPDSTLCYGGHKLLTLSLQPVGTTYRWSDGSTGPALLASQPGPYQVEITNAQGCSARASITLRRIDCALVPPNIITPNGDGLNETFVLPDQDPSHWDVQIFNRWGRLVYQQPTYHNEWNAADQPAGLYYYRLINSTTSQRLTGWVEVAR